MWLTKSSIGRKVVMSVTGIALVLFLTFHVLMNAVAVFCPVAYCEMCGSLGANWYAVAATLGLAALVVIHIIYAFWLTIQNKKARGNDAYEVTSRPKSVEWASQNMLVLGIVIACFTLLHLYQFWGHMMLAELFPCLGLETVTECGTISAADGWAQIMYQFSGTLGWGVLVVYLIGFVALWFHMTHGFWSAFQTLGTANDKWLPRLKCMSNAWATIVILLFAVEGVIFALKAHCTDCQEAVPAYELKIMEQVNAEEVEVIEAAFECTNHEGCQHGDCQHAGEACPDCPNK